MKQPLKDPSSTKYPDRTFWGGRWRKAEDIEKQLNRNRIANLSQEQLEAKRASKAKYMRSPAARQSSKLRRAGIRASGVCTNCEKLPLATSTSWLCNSCLDRLLTPERLMQARRREALKRRRTRTDG